MDNSQLFYRGGIRGRGQGFKQRIAAASVARARKTLLQQQQQQLQSLATPNQ
jgi:hypothetical protein